MKVEVLIIVITKGTRNNNRTYITYHDMKYNDKIYRKEGSQNDK